MGSMHKIEVMGVAKMFQHEGQDVFALKDTSFSLEEGCFATIIGPSGCGKSTLFNIIAGLMPPTYGDVRADGKSILNEPGYTGYMLQKDLLLPWRTILDNVTLGMEVRGVPRKEAVARAEPLMERYGLHGFGQHYPNQLSGGMRQRAALLRTLLYDRDILLLDEPFGALDAQTRASMQNWLLAIWKDFKKTILFVTHDIDEAIYLSDKIFVFSKRPGHLICEVDVHLKRPRQSRDKASEDFIRLKQYLMDLLFDPQTQAQTQAERQEGKEETYGDRKRSGVSDT